jgi:hypothetical protein
MVANVIQTIRTLQTFKRPLAFSLTYFLKLWFFLYHRSIGGPCLCEPHFSGPRCEYQNGTVPVCDLPCQNGQCVLGPINQPFFHALWKDVVIDINNDGNNDLDQMHCLCSSGYDGPLCDIPREECGDGTDSGYCYFGSKCITIENQLDLLTAHQCDCDSANTSTEKFVGRFCEYKSEKFCDVDHTHFCVNGGKCNNTITEGVCSCPDGFGGPSCEYELAGTDQSETLSTKDVIEGSGFQQPNNNNITDSFPKGTQLQCNLNCVHGQCRIGKKNVSDYFGQVIEHTQHLYDDIAEERYMHCFCEESWTGPLCNVQMSTCGDISDFCLHGSECLTSGKQQGCNCTGAHTNVDATYFAGQHCEHPVNDVCTEDANSIHGIPLSFCVNGGICKNHVLAGQPHPGCHCAQGFIGPHCELRESAQIKHSDLPHSWNPVDSRGNESHDALHISTWTKTCIAVFGALSFGFLLAYLFVRHCRQQRQQKETSTDWLSKYRDHPIDGDETNIAPRRESGFDFTFSKSNIHDAESENESPSTYQSNRDLMASQVASIAIRSPATSPPSTSLAQDHNYIEELGGNSSQLSSDDNYTREFQSPRDGILKGNLYSKRMSSSEPQVYLGPPRDEDGHVLHNVEIL